MHAGRSVRDPGNQISVNFVGLALSLQGLPDIRWVGRVARKRTKDRQVLRNWLGFSAVACTTSCLSFGSSKQGREVRLLGAARIGAICGRS